VIVSDGNLKNENYNIDKHEQESYIGIRSFLSSVVRSLLLATHRMILVFISCEVGGERTIVVLIEDAVDGCRDLIVDLGVNS
jgi:hypothetical protein